MKKYTETAHEERRTNIQELRNILMASPEMIETNLFIAKTIGRLSAQMPTKKRDLIAINIDIDYLLQHKVIELVPEENKTVWITICNNLR